MLVKGKGKEKNRAGENIILCSTLAEREIQMLADVFEF